MIADQTTLESKKLRKHLLILKVLLAPVDTVHIANIGAVSDGLTIFFHNFGNIHLPVEVLETLLVFHFHF